MAPDGSLSGLQPSRWQHLRGTVTITTRRGLGIVNQQGGIVWVFIDKFFFFTFTATLTPFKSQVVRSWFACTQLGAP